ncbi:MAG: outer membrane beta-barrel protein [Pseudomonadota bacterium]
MPKIPTRIATGTALAAAAAALVPAAAHAQDGRIPFNGPKVEVIAGYDHNRSGSSVDIDADRDFKQSIDGVVYGVGIGYDVNTGSGFVIGAEAELSDSTAKWDNDDDEPTTFNLGRVKANRDIYVGARVGFVMGERAMIYAKGGYTNARYSLLGTDGTTELEQSLDTDGYRVGAGVEYQLDNNVFTKVEYRYSHYKEGEFDFEGDTPDSSRFDIDTDRHQVVVGVGMRF